jgi:hypothetical protein
MKQRILSLLATMAFIVAGATAHAATPHLLDERDSQEIKTVFLQQAAAATAHDIVAFERVFASAPQGSPNSVTFVARAYQYWGKQALIDHFKETFKGVWKFEPDPADITVIPLTANSAEIYAPTQITFGTPDATAKTSPFLVCEVAVRTPEGWRIAAIIPVPAQ